MDEPLHLSIVRIEECILRVARRYAPNPMGYVSSDLLRQMREAAGNPEISNT